MYSKYKQKNVKPKKRKNKKKKNLQYLKRKQIRQEKRNKLNLSDPQTDLITIREIISMAETGDGSKKWLGDIYFGYQFDGKYRYSPKHNEMWNKNELTEEMLNLKFPNNKWYVEFGDLMFEAM